MKVYVSRKDAHDGRSMDRFLNATVLSRPPEQSATLTKRTVSRNESSRTRQTPPFIDFAGLLENMPSPEKHSNPYGVAI